MWRPTESDIDHDRSEEVHEISQALSRLAEKYGGKYSETLVIRDDGYVSEDSRVTGPTDYSRPFLVQYMSQFETSHGPRPEDIYKVLKDVGEMLPSYTISISEDPNRRSLTYTILKR